MAEIKTPAKRGRKPKAAPEKPSVEPVRAYDNVGDLSFFNINHNFQAAFIVPNEIRAYSRALTVFPDKWIAGSKVCVAGKASGLSRIPAQKVAYFSLRDLKGARLRVWFTYEGDSDYPELVELAAAGGYAYLYGEIKLEQGRFVLAEAEVVQSDERGRVIAYYPSKQKRIGVTDGSGKQFAVKKVRPEDTRREVHSRLFSGIPQATAFLRERMQLKDSADEWRLMDELESPDISLEGMLWELHQPTGHHPWDRSRAAIDRLAALELLQEVAKQRVARRDPAAALAIPSGTYATMKAQLEQNAGFSLTDEQDFVAREILRDLVAEKRMHRLLCGDVGCGKTEVFGLVAATLAQAGHTVALLTPRDLLTHQHLDRLRSYWPQLNMQVAPKNSTKPMICPPGSIILGYTGVWGHLGDPDNPPRLIICDEQQKMGVYARNPFSDSPVNMLEVTATPIPRTEGLILFGGLDLSQIKGRHITRNVHTELIETDAGRKAVFRKLSAAINAGDKVLVVYPRVTSVQKDVIEEGAEEEDDGRDESNVVRTVEDAFARWNDSFPGKVVALHGKMDDAEKVAAFNAFATDPAIKVCVSSIVVEVGVNVKGLRHIVIQSPERHGTSVTHQLRGRVGRGGEEAWCYLICPDPVKPAMRELLKMMETVDDGYRLAYLDMLRRGHGDLRAGATQQSGEYQGFLVGLKPHIESIEYVFERCQDWITRGCDGIDPGPAGI